MNCPICGGPLPGGEAACPHCYPGSALPDSDYLELPDGPRLPLDKDAVTLGRGVGNDYVLADTSISRRHARFQRLPHGWLLIDLNSSNGTWANGDQVVGPYLLQDGDQILLGEQPMVFRVRDVPRAPAPRPRERAQTLLGRAAFQVPSTPPRQAPPSDAPTDEHPTGGALPTA
jgi:pSer/pThr/pTyr-binding forkhead associated (FHA) protein